MSSWRDATSAEAQDDLDALLNVVIEFAQQQLITRGEFFPYAASISLEGDAKLLAALPRSEAEQPLSSDIVAACFGALSQTRETMRAGAVVTDVRVSGGGEAVSVDLEHVEGQAITVLLPYTRRRLRR